MLIERAEEKKNMLVRAKNYSVCSGALSAGKMQTKDSLTFRERKKEERRGRRKKRESEEWMRIFFLLPMMERM